ncbi:MAG: hypothetical protein HYZ81_11845 [Nitrospinae bacterium]|nr:hypothetical protein [Nitrospinota bacterium]
MPKVVDASCLISLEHIRRWDLLPKLGGDLLTPQVVYTEVVARGIQLGYPDAQETKRQLFDRQIVRLCDPQAIAAGASPDAVVLQLAVEAKAELYADDTALVRRARRAGVAAYRVPDVLLILLKAGQMSPAEYRMLLLELRAHNRIDEPTPQLYVGLGGV